MRSATRTSKPSRIASVSGSSIETVDPLPNSLASRTDAAELLHIAPDYVHAHAAPGEIADFFAGGKSRAKINILI